MLQMFLWASWVAANFSRCWLVITLEMGFTFKQPQGQYYWPGCLSIADRQEAEHPQGIEIDWHYFLKKLA